MARRARPSHVGRAEFDELRRFMRASTAELKGNLDKCGRDLDVQFERIAQIQAQLDEIRTAWSKVKPRRRREKRD